MKRSIFYIAVLVLTCALAAQESLGPVHTYSIVARDSVTGEMGVAVQSHWFSVGTVVTWAEAGVGVVATQSFAEISYGPLGLELMKAGKTAPQALRALISIDSLADVRQVAMIDNKGNIAVHTGAKCIAEAGHYKGRQFSTQANLMEKNTVWGTMAKAYEGTQGDLLDKLMAALEAAQAEGGDIRGMQSAAILIVPGKTSGQPWRERLVDLRIDDHPQPLEEMKRLIKVHRAYDHMNKGDERLAKEDVDGALEEYKKAMAYYPENLEVVYWVAVTLAGAGRLEETEPYFRRVFAEEPAWMELTKRLPQAGLLPNDTELLKRILSFGEK
jgi:uncharacterized Ntn-hydrolase superfamily protein